MMGCVQSIFSARTRPAPANATGLEWFALGVLMLPVLLISIDNTVLSFALPEISRVFTPTGVQMLWMVDAYPLMLAGLLVPAGYLGDHIGRRRLLLIGCTGFAAVSMVGAFATDATQLIAARAVLGIFGAALMPATLSLLRNIFLNPSQRRIALAIWASGFSAGAVLGPLLGGLLLEHFWWGAIFLIATAILIPALVLIPATVPESYDPSPKKVDYLSVVLVIVSITSLVYAIKAFATGGPSPVAAVCAIVALGLGWYFIRRQRRIINPIIDVSLFTNATFSGALFCNLMTMTCMTGFMFFYSQYVQLVQGFSPVVAGLMMFPGVVANIILGLLVVPILRRVRANRIVAGCLLGCAFGYGLATWAGVSGASTLAGLLLAASLVVFSAGAGGSTTICNDAILSAVDPHKAGAASAISEVAYEFGAVLGTAVLGTVLSATYSASLQLPEDLSVPAHATDTLGGAFDYAGTLEHGAAALRQVAGEAFMNGVAVSMALAVVLTVTAMLVGARTVRLDKH